VTLSSCTLLARDAVMGGGFLSHEGGFSSYP